MKIMKEGREDKRLSKSKEVSNATPQPEDNEKLSVDELESKIENGIRDNEYTSLKQDVTKLLKLYGAKIK